MKLGTQTGSFTNHVYSIATKGQPEPTIGMGATLLSWTDRHAATITAVFSVGKAMHVTVQQDHANRIDDNGMSEIQSYEYSPNPSGEIFNFRFSERTGQWQEVAKNSDTGRWLKREGRGLRIGERDRYYDFSF